MDDKNIKMPAIFHQALLISYAGLKSLDLVHLVAAKHPKKMNSDLDAFVTEDLGFLIRSDSLARLFF